MTRAELVAHARGTIARGSKSFALASRLFDRETRERAWLLYAWCRRCDDLADGQLLGRDMEAVRDPATRLAAIHMQTDQALAGAPVDDPAFAAFAIVADECALPRPYIDDVIEGFALDARGWRPTTENDLFQYCYHVAGAVGCLMAIVMGIEPDDEEMLDRACDLGIAFQLANIARDIAEDDGAGRSYLPIEWLAEMNIPPSEHMKPPFRPRLAVLAARLADWAEWYEASAAVGAAALPFRSRWAVLAAAGIYGDIAREVRRRGEHAWDSRTHTARTAKLAWVGKALLAALGRPRAVARDALWVRPRPD